MSKRSAVAALAITSLLLSACAANTDAGEGSAAEPRPWSAAPTAESPTQRPTTEPAHEPAYDGSEDAAPPEGRILVEGAAPAAQEAAPPAEHAPAVEHAPTVEAVPHAETPVPAPAPVPVPAPAPVPAPKPAPEEPEEPEAPVKPIEPLPVGPEAPVEPIEPLPVGPNDPFVPPPHGEPNPLAGAPYPDVLPGSPHTVPGPVTDENISVAHPQPGYPGPTVAIRPGLLRIGGHGYAAGEMISVLFSVPNSDDNILNHGQGARPEPVVVYADHNGSYTFDIQVSPELAQGEYAIMTWAPNRGADAAEASKRFLSVFVS